MADYEMMYQQSQVLIAKQKEQIRKLEEQIRERCQSYLIHSSRYKSKTPSSAQKNTSQAEQAGPILGIISGTVTASIEGEQNSHHQIMHEHSNKAQSLACNESSSVLSTPVKQVRAQTADQSTLTQQKAQQQPQIIQSSDKKQQLEGSANASVNWEQVVEGLKHRLSEAQKQKSTQVQRVHELEEELRNLKKQRLSWAEGNSSMKKKPSKAYTVQDNIPENETKPNQITISQQPSVGIEQLEKLWQALPQQLKITTLPTLQQRITQTIRYVKQMPVRKKLSHAQSNVQSYDYSTPYRKLKSGQNSIRDVYEEEQLELLRRKCQELQAELSVSRVNKNEESPLPHGQQDHQIEGQQDEEEVVNEPPYVIEEELQKPDNQFIKRSFVRKKIVKRNLSAMILRSPSQSKHQSRQNMQAQLEKLKSHLEKSKDGSNQKQISSLNRKIDKLEKSILEKTAQIDEMSDESSMRASGVDDQGTFTEIIQVETQGPGYKNYTAHILGLNRKDQSVTDRSRNKK